MRESTWIPVIGVVFALMIIGVLMQHTRRAEVPLQAAFAEQAALAATERALVQTSTALTPQPQLQLNDLGQLIPALPNIESIPGIPVGPAPIASATVGDLRVEVLELAPMPDGSAGVLMVGRITNVGQQAVTASISAFTLIDANGSPYIADNGAQAVLSPGQTTSLDLTVPVPPVKLQVELPNLEPVTITFP